jgi:tetratricopeptide (TPR) repeat protein
LVDVAAYARSQVEAAGVQWTQAIISVGECAIDAKSLFSVVVGPLVAILAVTPLARAADTEFERGMAALQKGDNDVAITCFTAAIKSNPKNDEAYARRGAAYFAKHDCDPAIKDFGEAIRLNPNSPQWHYDRGVVHTEKHDLDRAIQDYSQAIRLDRKFAPAHFNRGNAYYEKQDFDQAIKDFTEAIRLESKTPNLLQNPSNVFHNRGAAFLAVREFDSAIDDFSKAIRLDPKVSGSFGSRGLAYGETKQYAKAVADFAKTIELDPDDAFAHSRLAWHLATCNEANLRNGKDAVLHAKKACELNHWQEPGFLETLAAACAEAGDFKEAVKWQKKAESLVAGDKARQDEARKRLALYEKGEAYRDK